MTSKTVKSLLGESDDDVIVEIRKTIVNSMPHYVWLIRHNSLKPAQYIASGNTHSKKEAHAQIKAKSNLLGVRIVDVVYLT